ncbi:hypothetical protein B0T19DRAFT_435305 [Cercophora scortea]|uniref:Uncharacterized protein n=1 Tax=Cercophora scortea TaxID=314031 RepID=A0AAE0I2Y2_9PEZI|nr:hypothetical protein B0T19DRAFT_435305 [Cercophora scortea]
MCTYDYTPYTGCTKGQQHFFLQWMKCNKALDNGNRHCRLENSVEVEDLKRLSGNVLCCPIHSPIVVQQYEFRFQQTKRHDLPIQGSKSDDNMRPRSRALSRRSTCKPTLNEEGTAVRFDDCAEQEPRRKKKTVRGVSPATSHDSRPPSPPPSPDTLHPPREHEEHRPASVRRVSSNSKLRRRASSADVGHLPSYSTIRHSRAVPSIDSTVVLDDEPSTVTKKEESLNIAEVGRLGLPSKPDIHRRASMISRSGSDEVERKRAERQAAVNAGSDCSVASQDGDADVLDKKFEPPATRPTVRRGRTVTARGSEDKSMKRIEEDGLLDAGEWEGRERPRSRSALTLNVDDLHKRSKRESKYVRDTPPVCAATNPVSQFEQDDADELPRQLPSRKPGTHRSSSTNSAGDASTSTTAIRREPSRASRRYEDQLVEGRKWAAARDSMALAANMKPVTIAAYDNHLQAFQQQQQDPKRESNDSGYQSTHHHQPDNSEKQQPRNTLQKAPRPPALDLSAAAEQRSHSSPPKLPAAPDAGQAKGSLFKKMGLRRKISSLWERQQRNEADEATV